MKAKGSFKRAAALIQWLYFPRSRKLPELMAAVVRAFEAAAPAIDSAAHRLGSNGVLAAVAPGLAAAGFRVEKGQAIADKIPVPVLFGINGMFEKSFHADAHHETGIVLEVEAGRGYTNNQFLKD